MAKRVKQEEVQDALDLSYEKIKSKIQSHLVEEDCFVETKQGMRAYLYKEYNPHYPETWPNWVLGFHGLEEKY